MTTLRKGDSPFGSREVSLESILKVQGRKIIPVQAFADLIWKLLSNIY